MSQFKYHLKDSYGGQKHNDELWVDDHYLDPTWNVQSDLLVSSHNPDGIGWIFGPPIPVPNQFKKEG